MKIRNVGSSSYVILTDPKRKKRKNAVGKTLLPSTNSITTKPVTIPTTPTTHKNDPTYHQDLCSLFPYFCSVFLSSTGRPRLIKQGHHTRPNGYGHFSNGCQLLGNLSEAVQHRHLSLYIIQALRRVR